MFYAIAQPVRSWVVVRTVATRSFQKTISRLSVGRRMCIPTLAHQVRAVSFKNGFESERSFADKLAGKSVRCYFCGTCTSHIYHHQDVMPDKIIVRTLLLDGGPQMPATGEIFGEGRLSWVRELQDTLK